ncbi:MAG: hypothetical protein GF341_12190 [candidate division Zixibacteria bacterium]|nr:hypothetical protein [candidate division Zixibacteria bacterium]
MKTRRVGFVLAIGLALSLIVGAAPSKIVSSGQSDNTSKAVKTAPSASSVSTTPSHLPDDVLETPLSQGTNAANYEIPWSSINGGGAPSSSTNYSVNASVGQSAIGFATSTNYEAGIGYWYGAEATGGGCSCPFQCDFNEDLVLDAVDLNEEINALFFNGPNPQDPGCPTTRADFNNDGFPDATDLNSLIEHLFFNGPPPVDPCA